MYYTTKDVMRLLDLTSIRTAQRRIQALNSELRDQGYWIEKGKVPVEWFHKKYPYLREV